MSEQRDADAERTIAIEQWKTLIQTQIHFNDMILRTRGLVVTVALAAFTAGAAALSAEKYILTGFGFIHFSLAIVGFYWAIIADHDHEPKPFLWTADPDRVLAAINRGKTSVGVNH